MNLTTTPTAATPRAQAGKLRCAFCYDREQGTHGEIRREYLEGWQAMAPLCRLHSQASERAAHAARHTSDIDAGEEATRPPYDC